MSVPSFRVRRVNEEDRDLVHRLRASAYGFEDDPIPFRRRRAGIVMVGDEAVGVLRILKRWSRIDLESLHLAPEWQGKGIGTTIVTSLKRTARSRRIPIIARLLRGEPRAFGFYERMGFRPFESERTVAVLCYGRPPERWRPTLGDVIGMALVLFMGWGVIDWRYLGGEATHYLDLAGAFLVLYIAGDLCATGLDLLRRRDTGARLLDLGRRRGWFAVAALCFLLAVYRLGGSWGLAVFFLLVGVDLVLSGLGRGEIREGGIRLRDDAVFVPWTAVSDWGFDGDGDLVLGLKRWLPGTRRRRCSSMVPRTRRAEVERILEEKLGPSGDEAFWPA